MTQLVCIPAGTPELLPCSYWLSRSALSAGIVSCLDFNPNDPNMLAAGSYSSSAAVYDVATGTAAYILSGHKGGITQVKACRCTSKGVHVIVTSLDILG